MARDESAPSWGERPDVPAEIMLIDDDATILESLSLTFDMAGYRPIGFSDPIKALMWASDANPLCIVVDLRLPGVEGLDLVAAFCSLSRHAVVLLSAYADVQTTVEAMRLGVDNVLIKPTREEELIAAVERARKGLSTKPQVDMVTFTRRERQVAEMVVAGLTAKQMAQTLNLSPRTVEFFRASLMRKTQSRNMAALAASLTQLGIQNN